MRASIMRDWDDHRYALGFTFGRCWWGIFEGIDGERGIAWRAADSLALRRFLLIGLSERTPDHAIRHLSKCVKLFFVPPVVL